MKIFKIIFDRNLKKDFSKTQPQDPARSFPIVFGCGSCGGHLSKFYICQNDFCVMRNQR